MEGACPVVPAAYAFSLPVGVRLRGACRGSVERQSQARPGRSRIGEVSVVRIRMQRFGRHRRPFYRISAIDARTRRDGRVIEQLGWYDPTAADASKQINLNEERVKHWLSVGAQPSETVKSFFAKHNLIDKAEWEAERAAKVARVEAARAKKAPAEGEKKA